MSPELIKILLKIFIPLGICAGIFAYGHHKGYQESEQKAIAEQLKLQETITKQAENQSKVNDKVVTKYVDRLEQLNKATPELIDQIKKDLKNENVACLLPLSVIRVYDRSNSTQDAGTPSGSNAGTN